MEASKNNNKEQKDQQAKQTDSKQNEKKELNGTEDTSNWEKAATLIAGNNQLMAGLLKLLLSPFTLIAGAALIGYLFYKNHQLKKEIDQLKDQNKKLQDQKESLEEENETAFKKYAKLKKLIEVEQNLTGQLSLHHPVPNGNYSLNNQKQSYLR